MTGETPLFTGSGFVVGRSVLRTPRKTYALAQVEYVSVRRSLLIFVGLPAVGLIGLTFAFWRYLYFTEALVLLVGSIGALAAAAQFGTLRVHSLALRDDDVATSYGRIRTLTAVRRAIETAMAMREGGPS